MPLTPKLNKFTTQAPVNAVFNFTDFESGVLFTTYQGFASETSSALGYHMDNYSFHSSQVETKDLTTGVGTSPTFGTTLDLDFDTNEFTIPKDIEGTALVNVTAGIKFDSANTVSFRVEVTLSKYDGSTETALASAVSSGTSSQASNNTWKSDSFTVPIVIPRTHIAEGELLRCTVKHMAHTASSASAVDTALAHSPFDTSGSLDPSSQSSDYMNLIINVPFRRE